MSNTNNCVCRHRNRHIDIRVFVLVLLLSSLNHQRIEGRLISKLTEASQKLGQTYEESKALAKMVGSRPPRCVQRCRACVQCEAVLVPVASQHRLPCTNIVSISSSSSSSSSVRSKSRSSSLRPRGDGDGDGDGDCASYYSRSDDDFSKYKPISWKCKCGNLFFNP